MEYSIGAVSRLLGLSIEGIRNYEKSGIISSRREKDSNYRKYSYLDIASLIRSKMYRAYGFSMKETAELTNESHLEEITRAFETHTSELERELQLLREKLRCLNELRELTQNIDSAVGHIEICSMPAFYRFEFARNGEIRITKELTEQFQKWMQYAPFVWFSSRYRGNDVYGGLSIREQYASLFDIKEQNEAGIVYQPEAICLKLTVREGDRGFSETKTLDALKEYASMHQYSISEDFLALTVMGLHKSSDYQRYRQVFARWKKTSEK